MRATRVSRLPAKGFRYLAIPILLVACTHDYGSFRFDQEEADSASGGSPGSGGSSNLDASEDGNNGSGGSEPIDAGPDVNDSGRETGRPG